MPSSQTEVDPDFTFSRLTSTYCYRLQTAFGERIINTGCTNLKQAKLLIEESQAKNLQVAANVVRFTHEVISQLTVGRKSLKAEDVACEYLEWKKKHYSENTLGVETSFLKSAIRRLDLKKRYITDVTEEMLDKDVNPDDDTSEATRHKRMLLWRGFFKWLSNKYPYRNVASLLKVDHRKLLAHQRCGQRRPHHCVTNEDFEKIMVHLRQEYDRLLINRRMEIERCTMNGRRRLNLEEINTHIDSAIFHSVAFLVARFTGLRLGDICQLEWATLDDALSGQIKIWTKKTNTKIEMPFPERIQEALLMVPRTGSPYVFPAVRCAYRDLKITNKSCGVRFYRFLRYYQRDAKVPAFNWHDLRHTFITEVERKHGIKLASVWAGHRSTAQTEEYVHRGAQIEAPLPTWEGYDLAPPEESIG